MYRPPPRPSCKWDLNGPRRRSRSPRAQSHEFAETKLHVPGRLLDRVLGPCGSTLVELCQTSGASVALRPELRNLGDLGFVAEISGPASSVEAVELQLAEIIDANAVAFLSGGGDERSEENPPCVEDDSSAEMSVEVFTVPKYKSEHILGTRQPGGKGIGKHGGIEELQQINGVVRLEFLRNGSMGDLEAEGSPAALQRLRETVEARLAACKDVLEDNHEVPLWSLGMLFGNAQKIQYEVEQASGAFLSVRGPKDKERGVATVGIRGTLAQIEHVKALLSERVVKKKRPRPP